MTTPIERLGQGPLMLLFTPGLVPGVKAPAGEESQSEIATALAAFDSAISARISGGAAICAVQLRIKNAEGSSPARAIYTWAARLADVLAGHKDPPVLLINDRVDVALALSREVSGVHLGQTDLSIAAARAQLGAQALIGRSTHDFAQVLVATEEGANYLGFGPIHPTRTKGYKRGIGAEQAWIASAATQLALFPIGGIDASNAGEIGEIGRAAVSSSILQAPDPGLAAEAIARALI